MTDARTLRTTSRGHPLSVLIFSPVRVIASGVASLLSLYDGIHIAGTATSWKEAHERLPSIRPEVILLDVSTIAPLQYVSSLHQVSTATIVAFGVARDPRVIAHCARAGVHAFCDEHCGERELIATAVGSTRGELSLEPETASLLFRGLGGSLTADHAIQRTGLTEREADVLALLHTGATNKEIAAQMGLKVATVKNHVHRILHKLGVHTRAAAIGMRHSSKPADE